MSGSGKYQIVREAAEYCWSKKSNMMDNFRNFMDKHAPLFIGAPTRPENGEQDLEMFELYQDYMKLYEVTFSDYIRSLNVTVEEFYHELDDILNDKELSKKDKKVLYFANYLVASTDYPSFYKIMVRAAKRLVKEEAKAEAKGAGGGGGGGEGKGEAKSESKMVGDDGDAKADFK
jgi:hypothetical protein